MEIKFKLTNFLETVYNIDIESVTDYDTFYFEWVDFKGIYEFDKYVREFVKKHPEYSDAEYSDFERAANKHYEYSYIDDYWEEFKKRLEQKIDKDIRNVSKFYIDDTDEVATKAEIRLKTFDFTNDIITFEGNNVIDDFAAICVNCINGYGMFYYDSIEDFYDTQPAETDKEKMEAVENHLHWLQHFESIYGTIYNAFREDFSEIDRYGCLGNFDFTVEDLELALN